MIKLKREGAASNKPANTVNLWAIDLNKFFDAVNYRLAVMRKRLSTEVVLLEQEVLKCTSCNIRYADFSPIVFYSLTLLIERSYRSIELTVLMNKERPGVYNCRVCGKQLDHTNHTDSIRLKQQMLKDLDTTITPLREMLLKLLRSTHSESAASVAIGGSQAAQPQRKLPGRLAQPAPAKRLFPATKEEKKSVFSTAIPKLSAVRL